jgi:hypothetical protein
MAQVLSFPRRAAVIKTLKAAEDELKLVAAEETDTQAAADLFAVVERLEEIILRIQMPL